MTGTTYYETTWKACLAYADDVVRFRETARSLAHEAHAVSVRHIGASDALMAEYESLPCQQPEENSDCECGKCEPILADALTADEMAFQTNHLARVLLSYGIRETDNTLWENGFAPDEAGLAGTQNELRGWELCFPFTPIPSWFDEACR